MRLYKVNSLFACWRLLFKSVSEDSHKHNLGRYECNISDVMEYEPDADMIFNYLMVSALAAATDFVEKEGLKPTGGEL